MTGEQLGNPSTAGADHVDRGNNDHYNDDYLP
jgi:hypothetical protein